MEVTNVNWTQFYLSPEYDLLMFGMLAFISIVGLILLLIQLYNFWERRRQEEQMESFLTLIEGDSAMDEFNDLLKSIGGTKIPITPNANRRQVAMYRGMMDAAMCLHSRGAAAIDTIAQAQTGFERLSNLSNRTGEFEQAAAQVETLLHQLQEVITSDVAHTAALENATPPEQAALPDASVPAEAPAPEAPAEGGSTQASEAPTQAVDKGCEVQSDAGEIIYIEIQPAQDETPFSLDDLRTMVRLHECLKHAYHISNPGKSVAENFIIREKDARTLANILIAKEKQEKLHEIPNGKRALKFLQEEYTPAE